MTTPRLLDPENLEGETQLEAGLRPRSLDEFIGQSKVKENLRIFIEAAKARSEALDHVLVHGFPGLGKTTLAYIISQELQVNLKTTSGPVIERPGDLAALLTNLQSKEVLFIDEIHRLNHVVEEILYPAMEDFQLDLLIGQGPSARSVKLDLPKFTLVGATTRAGLLTPPLRDRFGVILRVDFYSPEELRTILTRSAAILKISAEKRGCWRSPDGPGVRRGWRIDSCVGFGIMPRSGRMAASRCRWPGRPCRCWKWIVWVWTAWIGRFS